MLFSIVKFLINNFTTYMPWIISIASVIISVYIAKITKKTQELIANKEQQIKYIDDELAILREDMVRFYSAQANTNGREHVGLTQAAYQILCANPLSTDKLKESAYKVLELDNIAACKACGREIKPDEKVQGLTSEKALEEFSSTYISIVERKQEDRNRLIRQSIN